MRATFVLSTFLVIALAGCLQGQNSGDLGDTDGSSSSMGDYNLDCSLSNWAEPCLIHASPNPSPSKTEIDIVINPLDPNNIVVAAKDNDETATVDCVWSVAQVSKDAGKSWTTVYIGGQISERQPDDLLYGYACVSDPIMKFNKDGDLFYTLQVSELEAEPKMDRNLADPDSAFQGMAISHDGGMTWPEQFVLQRGDHTTVFPDYIRMGTNPATGTIFTTWNNIVGLASSQPIIFPIRDGAAGTPWQFNSPDRSSLGESAVVGATDGTIYVCLCGPNSGPNAFWSVSNDDGATFSVPELVFTYEAMGNMPKVEFRSSSRVEVEIDNSGGERDGCLYGTWAGRDLITDETDPADVYVRRSCDGGSTWTEPVMIHDGLNKSTQWMSRITVDGAGVPHVVYLTQNYDTIHNHTWIDAEWAYSTDGGETWITKRLTTIPFDGDLGVHQRDFPFIGDYIGIDSVGTDVWMGFPTTFTGVAEIAVAHASA